MGTLGGDARCLPLHQSYRPTIGIDQAAGQNNSFIKTRYGIMPAEGESEGVLMQSSRILDRLTGRGGVERNGEIICEVDYEIIVSQPSAETKVETQSDTEVESRPDMPDARGRLRVLDGKRNLMEGDLTLRLNDGRQWKFTVTNGNPVSALYMVVQTGGDSLAPVQT